jgi:uncharacterized protein YjbI with pentapeptide repeats
LIVSVQAAKARKTIFTGAKLTSTNMAGAQATAADFTDADLSGVNLTDANLGGASFEGANLTDADLTGSNLSHANMRSSIITGTLMARTERTGLDLSGSVTERDMGSKLENLGKTLPELLEEHTLWVATAGRSGRQLDLSGYDLRDVLDLKKFPLTAIHCVGGNFLNQDLRGAEMQSGVFDRSDFRDCKMVEADLRGSSFKYAKTGTLRHDEYQTRRFEIQQGRRGDNQARGFERCEFAVLRDHECRST